MADNTIEMQSNEQAPKKKGHFLREVMVELKKTNWLTKNELMKSTTTVLLTIVVVSIILYIYDRLAGFIMLKLGIG